MATTALMVALATTRSMAEMAQTRWKAAAVAAAMIHFMAELVRMSSRRTSGQTRFTAATTPTRLASDSARIRSLAEAAGMTATPFPVRWPTMR